MLVKVNHPAVNKLYFWCEQCGYTFASSSDSHNITLPGAGKQFRIRYSVFKVTCELRSTKRNPTTGVYDWLRMSDCRNDDIKFHEDCVQLGTLFLRINDGLPKNPFPV